MRPLPDGCHLEDDHLVCYEVALPAVLGDEDSIYEHVCYIACTHGLRPAGPVQIRTRELPQLGEDEVAVWGGRSMTAPEVASWADQGMVLAQLRLPVTAMGYVPDPAAGRPSPPAGPPSGA